MSEKKVTDVLLERIKYFINAIENGEYEPKGYEFTIKLKVGSLPTEKTITIADCYSILER